MPGSEYYEKYYEEMIEQARRQRDEIKYLGIETDSSLDYYKSKLQELEHRLHELEEQQARELRQTVHEMREERNEEMIEEWIGALRRTRGDNWLRNLRRTEGTVREPLEKEPEDSYWDRLGIDNE